MSNLLNTNLTFIKNSSVLGLFNCHIWSYEIFLFDSNDTLACYFFLRSIEQRQYDYFANFFMSSQNNILLNLLSRKLTLVFYFINCRSGSVCLDVINQSWSPMFGNYQLSMLILFLVKKRLQQLCRFFYRGLYSCF